MFLTHSSKSFSLFFILLLVWAIVSALFDLISFVVSVQMYVYEDPDIDYRLLFSAGWFSKFARPKSDSVVVSCCHTSDYVLAQNRE